MRAKDRMEDCEGPASNRPLRLPLVARRCDPEKAPAGPAPCVPRGAAQRGRTPATTGFLPSRLESDRGIPAPEASEGPETLPTTPGGTCPPPPTPPSFRPL